MNCGGSETLACGMIEGSKQFANFTNSVFDPFADIALLFLVVFAVITLIFIGSKVIQSARW